MDAVVPAAGRGTRLRPLTDTRPKGLLEVANEPILAHVFDRLLEVDVDTIVVVVGYRGDQIIDYFGDSYRNTPIEYAHQDERNGLAHAIAQTEDVVDDEFLVVNGDNVFGTSLEPVVRTHRQPDVDATLLVEQATTEISRTTGVVQTADDGTVHEIVEKPDEPPTTRITTGVYALPDSIFDHCRAISPSDRGEYELADALERLRNYGGRIETVELEGWRVNVNTERDLERAATFLTE